MEVSERGPERLFLIQDPSKYVGQLGAQGCSLWESTDKVWVVNGHINKGEGNFNGAFFFKTIEDSGVTLGSHPANEFDV